MSINEVIWMPRKDAEDAVRARKVTRLDGRSPVAIGLHPADHHLACILMTKPSDERDPVPVWNGVTVYRMEPFDFE